MNGAVKNNPTKRPRTAQPKTKKWYKNWWGISVIVLAFLAILIILAISYQFLVYFQELQNQGATSNVNDLGTISFNQLVTDDDPSIGPDDAKIVIVEFADFECPYCYEASSIIRRIVSEYSDSVRYIYRDFPVPEYHPNAFLAAEAGECANDQNKFWIMHDKMFQNQDSLEEEDLKRYALEAGLNTEWFNRCLSTEVNTEEVQADILDGLKAGVNGTPTFIINGYQVSGVVPADTFREIIDTLLSEEE